MTSEGVFDAADALLVPTIPATLSARTLEQLDGFLDGVDGPPLVLPFISMIDRRRTVHRQVAASLAEAWPQLLATQVPNVATVERMGVERAPLAVVRPRQPRRDGVPRPVAGDLSAPVADLIVGRIPRTFQSDGHSVAAWMESSGFRPWLEPQGDRRAGVAPQDVGVGGAAGARRRRGRTRRASRRLLAPRPSR